jgi:SEC-C motif-containing protein
MRSRFSAFALRDAAYLLRTWHPDTRPSEIDFDRDMRWVRLEVVSSTGGSYFDTAGTVEFRAYYSSRGRSGLLHENSRFARVEGAWRYVDGDIRG